MQYAFIDYAPHAAGRFAPRHISEATIRDIVQEPTVRYRSRDFPDRLIAERELPSEPALRIVYVERLDGRGLGAYVITVYPIATKRMGKGVELMRIELHPGDLLRINLRTGEAADTVALADLVYLVVDADGHPLALDFVAADAFLPFLRAQGGAVEIPEYVDPATDDATDNPLQLSGQSLPRPRTA